MRAAAHLAGQASDRVLHGGHRVTEDFQPLINPELRNGELILVLVVLEISTLHKQNNCGTIELFSQQRLMPFSQSLREHPDLRASFSPHLDLSLAPL